jgi:hypothetical protein
MGFNTVAFFLNDMSDQIEGDPQTISRLMNAMRSGRGYDGRQYMRVLPSQHADHTQVLLAGQNRITTLPIVMGWDHTEEALLRALADHLGYRLVAKRRPTPSGERGE